MSNTNDNSGQLVILVEFSLPGKAPRRWDDRGLEGLLEKTLGTIVTSPLLLPHGSNVAVVQISSEDEERVRPQLPMDISNAAGMSIHVKLNECKMESSTGDSPEKQFVPITVKSELELLPAKRSIEREVVDLTDATEEESRTSDDAGLRSSPEIPVFRTQTPGPRVFDELAGRRKKPPPFVIKEDLSEIDHEPPMQRFQNQPIPMAWPTSLPQVQGFKCSGPEPHDDLLRDTNPTPEFLAWVRNQGLKSETIEKLLKEDIDNFKVVSSMGDAEINGLKLTMGQRLALKKAIEQIQTPDPLHTNETPSNSTAINDSTTSTDTLELPQESKNKKPKRERKRKSRSDLESSSPKISRTPIREPKEEIRSESCNCQAQPFAMSLAAKRKAYNVTSETELSSIKVMTAEDTLDPHDEDATPLLLIAKSLFQLDSTKILKITSTDGNGADLKFSLLGKKMDHPLDKIMTLIHSSNDFLVQDLLAKLARCHVAVPWIYPESDQSNIYLSWSLQNIIVKYGSQDGTIHEQPMISTPFCLIGFIRFGATTTSKSFVASRVLSNSSDDHHHYFWHKDGLSNTKAKEVSAGVVDAFWYLPTGNSDDRFTSPLLIANLHGCSSKFSRAASFLWRKSRVLCVFLSDQDMADHFTGLLILSKTRDSGLKTVFILDFKKDESLKEFKYAMGNLFKNGKATAIETSHASSEDIAERVREEIGSYINEKELRDLQLFKIENGLKESQMEGFRVDSNRLRIVTVEESSQKSSRLMKSHPKEQVLKLQQLSEALSNNEKECEKQSKRPEDVSVPQYIEELHMKMKSILSNQVKILKKQLRPSSNAALADFLGVVMSLETRNLVYFLRSFQYHLDKATRRKLGPLKRAYYENESAVAHLKKSNQGDVAELMEIARLTVVEQINSAQLGMEHILREIAIVDTVLSRMAPGRMERPEWFHRLPDLQVKMLLQGVPMEIMDGDSGSVQLDWIRKVFASVEKHISSAGGKVAILSVLGVQSSGKSTMLNTAFGMNFAVSAGRCTRGIYAQLIPLEPSKRQLLNCDFILLLDTEGLRAPELSTASCSYDKDNELATFIVGTSDLTIINVMGETGTEMNDVLQIVIQALLRMKKVEVSPKCVMVHQNVNDIQAFESTKAARKNLKEILDEATRCAAQMEKSPERKFTDVIEFNYDDPTCVWYVPTLFSGTHINPKYVQKVRDLKECIFNKLSERKDDFLPMENIPDRISTLWKAVIREDFVFHFKNSREVIAYRQLQDEIARWNWSLSEAGSECKRQAVNKINGCWRTENSLVNPIDLNQDLRKTMGAKCDTATTSLEAFFGTSQYKLMMEQWRSQSLRKLESHKDSIVEEVWNHCLEEIQSKKLEEAVKRNNGKYETMMIEVARKTLETMHIRAFEKSDEDVQPTQLYSEFEKFWEECIKNLFLEEGFKELKPVNVEAAITRSMKLIFNNSDVTNQVNRLQNSENQVTWSIKKIPANQWEKLISPNTITEKAKKFVKKPFMRWLTEQNLEDLDNFAKNLAKSIDDHLNAIEKNLEGINITSTDTDEIFNLVLSKLSSFEDSFPTFKLENDFKALTIHYAAEEAGAILSKAQTRFIRLNDPRVMFALKCKKAYFEFFKGKFQGISNANIIASHLKNTIRIAIEGELKKKYPHLLATRLMCNTSFPKSKQSLIAYMLLRVGHELKQDRSLKRMMNLIRKPFDEMEATITDLVDVLFEKDREGIESAIQREIDNLVDFTKCKITERTETDFTDWINRFQEEINSSGQFNIDLPTEHYIGMKTEGTVDVDEIKSQLIAESEEWCTPSEVGTEVEGVADLIIGTKILVGCREKCPFCNVFCDLTDADHIGTVNHSCQLHWPNAVAGWRTRNSQVLHPDICTVNIASDRHFYVNYDDEKPQRYKDYKKFYPSWDIVPDTSLGASSYWKWFLGNFSKELTVEYVGTKPPNIPPTWKLTTWEEAKLSLSSVYNVTFDDTLIEALFEGRK